MDLPGLVALLLVELFILTPVAFTHLLLAANKLKAHSIIKNIIGFREPMRVKQFLKWTLIGILGCIVVYLPFYPAGIFLRENLFGWLPEWYFNPAFGSQDVNLLAKVFLAGIIADGIVAPVAEELFFRGYLLPRMAFLKNWAPVINGTLFGLYHFWQPHNYPAIIGIGIVISYLVWKKKNVYLGIAIHCFLNITGALGGYLAAIHGDIIAR